MVEPKHHVTEAAYKETVSLAVALGFEVVSRPSRNWSWAVLLKKL
jgi:hypothetical protein